MSLWIYNVGIQHFFFLENSTSTNVRKWNIQLPGVWQFFLTVEETLCGGRYITIAWLSLAYFGTVCWPHFHLTNPPPVRWIPRTNLHGLQSVEVEPCIKHIKNDLKLSHYLGHVGYYLERKIDAYTRTLYVYECVRVRVCVQVDIDMKRSYWGEEFFKPFPLISLKYARLMLNWHITHVTAYYVIVLVIVITWLLNEMPWASLYTLTAWFQGFFSVIFIFWCTDTYFTFNGSRDLRTLF